MCHLVEKKDDRREHFEPNFDKLVLFMKYKKHTIKKMEEGGALANEASNKAKEKREGSPEVADYFERKRTKLIESRKNTLDHKEHSLANRKRSRRTAQEQLRKRNSRSMLDPLQPDASAERDLSYEPPRKPPQTSQPGIKPYKRLAALSGSQMTSVILDSSHDISTFKRSKDPPLPPMPKKSAPAFKPMHLHQLRTKENTLRRREYFGIYLPLETQEVP